MKAQIGIGMAVVLAAAALVIVLFFPDPLSLGEAPEPSYSDIIAELEPGLYTKRFVEDAVRRYDRDGRDATIAHFNTEESVNGEWYVFIVDEDGVIVSHPTIPDNVGRSLTGVLGTDITGKDFGEQMLATTEDGQWIDYTFLNPSRRNQQEVKHSWVVKHDELLFGSGWYERSSDSESVIKSDPAGYTKAFVEKAINRYENEGREATVEYYNTAASVDGQWYIFIADDNDAMIAHATIPENIGKDLKEDFGKDIYGYDFGRELIGATGEGKWVDYFYLNPAQDERRERKHSWVVKHDGLLFGSGWYEVADVVDFLLPPGSYYYLTFP